jgi:hypothetical protein
MRSMSVTIAVGSSVDRLLLQISETAEAQLLQVDRL